jgi:AcrR family transcriptional regulator
VIADRGLASTRIADVAERAGTSAPAVLYWFENKDAPSGDGKAPLL